MGCWDGTVMSALASQHYGQGSIPGPGVTCGLNFLLVLVPAPRVFLRIFLLTKTNASNSNLIRSFDHHVILKWPLQVNEVFIFLFREIAVAVAINYCRRGFLKLPNNEANLC